MDNFDQDEGAPGLDSETGDEGKFVCISAPLSHYARVVGHPYLTQKCARNGSLHICRESSTEPQCGPDLDSGERRCQSASGRSMRPALYTDRDPGQGSCERGGLAVSSTSGMTVSSRHDAKVRGRSRLHNSKEYSLKSDQVSPSYREKANEAAAGCERATLPSAKPEI